MDLLPVAPPRLSLRRLLLLSTLVGLAGFGIGFYLVWAAALAPAAPAGVGAAADEHTSWWLARASGIVAYLLLFGSVALGLALAGRGLERSLGALRLFVLHEFISLLTFPALALHLTALALDRYFAFTPAELLIPGLMPYRPLWTALGVLALYLTVSLALSFYVRGWLGFRVWRALHYGTFLAFVLALGHGLGAGTDSLTPWMRAVYVLTALATLALIVFRVASRVPGRRSRADGQ